jgi:hypothetical protein
MHAHRLAEERSLELHRKIAALLQQDPALVERARVRVKSWLADGSVHPHYTSAWIRLLEGPFETLLAILVDEGEEARALRQATPFAGFVDPRTRWKIWREVRERIGK